MSLVSNSILYICLFSYKIFLSRESVNFVKKFILLSELAREQGKNKLLQANAEVFSNQDCFAL